MSDEVAILRREDGTWELSITDVGIRMLDEELSRHRDSLFHGAFHEAIYGPHLDREAIRDQAREG